MKKLVLAILVLCVATGAYGQDFLNVVMTGNAADVVAAIDAGADVNAGDRITGVKPIQWAAFYNTDPEVIRVLIRAGADAQERTAAGTTPLMWAAGFNENPEVVEVLVESGARVNDSDSKGLTPLMYAAKNHIMGPGAVFVLLKAGARVNERDSLGMTALMWAAGSNPNPEAVTALLDAGADGRMESARGWNAFDYAYYHNRKIQKSPAYKALDDAR